MKRFGAGDTDVMSLWEGVRTVQEGLGKVFVFRGFWLECVGVSGWSV
jgi:hypothetical protein